jgi:hypothetical protein
VSLSFEQFNFRFISPFQFRFTFVSLDLNRVTFVSFSRLGWVSLNRKDDTKVERTVQEDTPDESGASTIVGLGESPHG